MKGVPGEADKIVKTRISGELRIVREGEAQGLDFAGELYRLPTGSGWAITSEDMTFVVRTDEVRLTRRGQTTQEQRFRVGHALPGTIGTEFGTLQAEAVTHRLLSDLTAAGGTVEWEYDMRMADQELGRCAITLLIREETTE